MTSELFILDGKRKYLTAEEQGRFIEAANTHERAEVRTLCVTLAYTGCRGFVSGLLNLGLSL